MIPGDSAWFAGHFPGNPILPALGLLGMIDKLLHVAVPDVASSQLPLQFRRVRFRRIVRPGEELTLELEPADSAVADRYRFRISSEEERVAEGSLLTESLPEALLGKTSAEAHVDLASRIPIVDLVPQTKGMRLVERFEGFDKAQFGTTLTQVREVWPLCNGGFVSPLVMVELVAQATAAMAGWEDLMKGLTSCGFGYIVGIKRAWLTGAPIPVNSELTMRTRKVLAEGNYGVFSGEVSMDRKVLGEVMLQVFRPEEGRGMSLGLFSPETDT